VDTSAQLIDTSGMLGGQPLRFQVQDGGPRENATGSSWGDEVPGPTLRFSAEHAQRITTPAGTVIRWIPTASMSLILGSEEVYALEPDDTIDERQGPGAALALGGDAAGLDVPVPVAAGHWLLSLYVWYQTDCISGDGYVDLLLITE
jgi:hypothetical protein